MIFACGRGPKMNSGGLQPPGRTGLPPSDNAMAKAANTILCGRTPDGLNDPECIWREVLKMWLSGTTYRLHG